MMNCTSELYNPQIRDQRALGVGSARAVYEVENGMVMKVSRDSLYRTIQNYPNLITKEYTPDNINELIELLAADENIGCIDVRDILYYYDQVFSEWNLWNLVTKEEQEILAPIIGIGYDEYNLPFTIMKKAEYIADDFSYSISPQRCTKIDCKILGDEPCNNSTLFNCSKCSNAIISYTYRSGDTDNLHNFAKYGGYEIDVNFFIEFCAKYNLSDVFNNMGNIGIFDDKVKIIDYGFVNGASNYQYSYNQKKNKRG